MIVHNTGALTPSASLAQITNQVAQGYNGGWNGSGGIVSSTAAANTSHLTALGAILNDNGTNTQTPIYTTTFESGYTVSDSDVLVKYTYYGDANLDGKVDGSDYSRIDNAYLQQTSPHRLVQRRFQLRRRRQRQRLHADRQRLQHPGSRDRRRVADTHRPNAVARGFLGGA